MPRLRLWHLMALVAVTTFVIWLITTVPYRNLLRALDRAEASGEGYWPVADGARPLALHRHWEMLSEKRREQAVRLMGEFAFHHCQTTDRNPFGAWRGGNMMVIAPGPETDWLAATLAEHACGDQAAAAAAALSLVAASTTTPPAGLEEAIVSLLEAPSLDIRLATLSVLVPARSLKHRPPSGWAPPGKGEPGGALLRSRAVYPLVGPAVSDVPDEALIELLEDPAGPAPFRARSGTWLRTFAATAIETRIDDPFQPPIVFLVSGGLNLLQAIAVVQAGGVETRHVIWHQSTLAVQVAAVLLGVPDRGGPMVLVGLGRSREDRALTWVCAEVLAARLQKYPGLWAGDRELEASFRAWAHGEDLGLRLKACRGLAHLGREEEAREVLEATLPAVLAEALDALDDEEIVLSADSFLPGSMCYSERNGFLWAQFFSLRCMQVSPDGDSGKSRPVPTTRVFEALIVDCIAACEAVPNTDWLPQLEAVAREHLDSWGHSPTHVAALLPVAEAFARHPQTHAGAARSLYHELLRSHDDFFRLRRYATGLRECPGGPGDQVALRILLEKLDDPSLLVRLAALQPLAIVAMDGIERFGPKDWSLWLNDPEGHADEIDALCDRWRVWATENLGADDEER